MVSDFCIKSFDVLIRNKKGFWINKILDGVCKVANYSSVKKKLTL